MMVLDHTRALPVAPERLEHLALTVLGASFMVLSSTDRLQILQLGLQGEQIELLADVRFCLQEAHAIYDARFR